MIEFIALGMYIFEVMWEIKFRILLCCERVLVETYFFFQIIWGFSKGCQLQKQKGDQKDTVGNFRVSILFQKFKKIIKYRPLSCFLINMTNHGLYIQFKTNMEFHVVSDEQLTFSYLNLLTAICNCKFRTLQLFFLSSNSS